MKVVWSRELALADLRAADPPLLQQPADGGTKGRRLHPACMLLQKEDVQGGRTLLHEASLVEMIKLSSFLSSDGSMNISLWMCECHRPSSSAVKFL